MTEALRLSTAIAAAWDAFEQETGEAPGDDEMAHIAAHVADLWFASALGREAVGE